MVPRNTCFHSIAIYRGPGIFRRVKTLTGGTYAKLDPFVTAALFWGQITWSLSGLSPTTGLRS